MNYRQKIKSFISENVPKSWIYNVRENILNEAKYQIQHLRDPQWQTEAMKNLLQRPIRLGIEVTNTCNANCVFCAYQYQQRPKKIMSQAIFEKTVHEYVAVGGGIMELTPVVGESFVDPDILQRIRFAASFPEINPITIFTNAILLDKYDFQEILKAGMTEILISTSGFDQSMYERIYRSTNYTRVIRNIESLLKQNEAMGKPVKITIFIRGDRSIAEMENFPDFKRIKQYKCDIIYTYFYDDWGGFIKPSNLPKRMKIVPSITKNGPCHQLIFYPKVLVDGSVTLCGCRDFNGNSELVIGNIGENSLYEIWTNGKLEAMLNRFNNKDYPPICKSCNIYRSLKHFVYSKTGRQTISDIGVRIAKSNIG